MNPKTSTLPEDKNQFAPENRPKLTPKGSRISPDRFPLPPWLSGVNSREFTSNSFRGNLAHGGKSFSHSCHGYVVFTFFTSKKPSWETKFASCPHLKSLDAGDRRSPAVFVWASAIFFQVAFARRSRKKHPVSLTQKCTSPQVEQWLGSLYYQPKQCTIIREIPQNYRRCVLLNPTPT